MRRHGELLGSLGDAADIDKMPVLECEQAESVCARLRYSLGTSIDSQVRKNALG